MTTPPSLTLPASVAALLDAPTPAPVTARVQHASWTRTLGDLEGAAPALDLLADGIDRAAMCRHADTFLAAGRTVAAFVVTMAWGYGNAGYGPYRTRVVLTGARKPAGRALDPSVVARLDEAVRRARTDGAVEGYRYLNNTSLGRIVHLGPAFFTKWLYAATARGVHDADQAAPVLDQRVLGWLDARTDLVLRPGYTDDYAAYVAALTTWGAAATPRRSVVAVEGAIFAATA